MKPSIVMPNFPNSYSLFNNDNNLNQWKCIFFVFYFILFSPRLPLLPSPLRSEFTGMGLPVEAKIRYVMWVSFRPVPTPCCPSLVYKYFPMIYILYFLRLLLYFLSILRHRGREKRRENESIDFGNAKNSRDQELTSSSRRGKIPAK